MINKVLKTRVYFTCISILALGACNYDPTYKDEMDAIDWENEQAPLTYKELSIIDSINKLGFKTSIKHPYIGRKGSKFSTYSIDLSNDTFLLILQTILN